MICGISTWFLQIVTCPKYPKVSMTHFYLFSFYTWVRPHKMKNAEWKPPVHDLGYLIPVPNAPVTLGRNWILRWPLRLIWNSLDLKCRVEDLYLPPKYFSPYFGKFGSIIPQNDLMPKCPKTGKILGLKETSLDVKYEYKDLFIHAHHLGALNHFPKFP